MCLEAFERDWARKHAHRKHLQDKRDGFAGDGGETETDEETSSDSDSDFEKPQVLLLTRARSDLRMQEHRGKKRRRSQSPPVERKAKEARTHRVRFEDSKQLATPADKSKPSAAPASAPAPADK